MFRRLIIAIFRFYIKYFLSGYTKHTWAFILATNQLDAQNFCLTRSLFHASTCFEHHVLIIRRSKLYYTVSGIITLKQVSGLKLLKCTTHLFQCDDTRDCIIQF